MEGSEQMALVIKSLTTGKISSVFQPPTDEELEIINSRTLRPFSKDEIVCLTVHMANNQTDKVKDVLSEQFLQEFAELASENLKGQLDHSESVSQTWSNIFTAQVVDLPNGIKEVEGRAYVVLNEDNKKILDKIESGTIGEISISFNGTGHQEGDVYIWDHCECAREFSLVVCPCQFNTGVSKELKGQSATFEHKDTTNKTLSPGGGTMKKKDYIFSKLRKIVAKSAPDDRKDEIGELLDAVENADSEAEVDAQDIESLIAENDSLKAEIERLKAELEQKDEELKACKADAEAKVAEAEETAIDEAIKSFVQKSHPINATVAEDMIKNFDRTKLSFDHATKTINGLQEASQACLKRYDGLCSKKFTAPFVSKDRPKATEVKKEKIDKQGALAACLDAAIKKFSE